jgi:hypothetical protein
VTSKQHQEVGPEHDEGVNDICHRNLSFFHDLLMAADERTNRNLQSRRFFLTIFVINIFSLVESVFKGLPLYLPTAFCPQDNITGPPQISPVFLSQQ